MSKTITGSYDEKNDVLYRRYDDAKLHGGHQHGDLVLNTTREGVVSGFQLMTASTYTVDEFDEIYEDVGLPQDLFDALRAWFRSRTVP